MTKDYLISPQGDRALVVRFGQTIDPQIHRRVMALMNYLTKHPHPAVAECVPAYSTLTIFYDSRRFVASHSPVKQRLRATETRFLNGPYETLRDFLENIIAQGGLESVDAAESESRVVEIPVRYGGDDGPDLNTVAEHCRLRPEEVIKLHSAAEYLVYLIGFAPGFPYLGGMSERLAVPRRSTPRAKIPPGSIGIGGAQTGIYPLETPGGWHLIGRTQIKLFDSRSAAPILLRAGDRVRFRPILPDAGASRR